MSEQQIKLRWLEVTVTKTENIGSKNQPYFKEFNSVLAPVLQMLVSDKWVDIETEYEVHTKMPQND